MTEMTEKTFFGHPRGLATLFFTEMWERFSYYGMRGLLVLFMMAKVENGGFGYDDEKASAIYGLYTAFVYLLALGGGWLADHKIGQRKAVWYGGIIIAAGHFSMAVPMESTFFLGLILIVIGTGLLKPNVSTIVGDLYPEGGARRDAGFSVFYMGINIGAFAGPLLCGFLGENIDWHLGFSLAGFGMVLGLIQYKMTEKYLGDCGIEPKAKAHDTSGEKSGGNVMAIALTVLFVGCLLGAHFGGMVNLSTASGLASATKYIIIGIAVLYFTYTLVAGGFNADQKKRIVLIMFLFVASAIFWSGFEQAGSSLNLFAKYFTDRGVFGWEMPASWLQSVNPIFIIVLAPFFGAMWIKLGAKNMDPSIPAKFALGLLFLGLGFAVIAFAVGLAANNTDGVTPFWLCLVYLLHTTGELCLSPVGLSTITKLAPRRITGQMMGIWFLATSLGNLIAGQIAGKFSFAVFENADVAKSALDEATALTPEVLEKIDPSIIEKVGETVIQNNDLEGFKAAVAELLVQSKEQAVQTMPDLFWQIVWTCLGGALVLFICLKPLRSLSKTEH